MNFNFPVSDFVAHRCALSFTAPGFDMDGAMVIPNASLTSGGLMIKIDKFPVNIFLM